MMSEPAALDLTGLLQAALLPASGAALRGVDANHASFANLLSLHMQPESAAETLELMQPSVTDGRPVSPHSPLTPQLPLDTASAPGVAPGANGEPVTSSLLPSLAMQVRPTAPSTLASVKIFAGTKPTWSTSTGANTETRLGTETTLRPLVPGPVAQGSGSPMSVVALTEPGTPGTGHAAGQTMRPQPNSTPVLRKPDGQTRVDQSPAARLLQPQPASQDPDLQTQMADSLPDPAQAEKLVATVPTMKLAQALSPQKGRAMQGRNKLVQASPAGGSIHGVAAESTVQDRPLTPLLTETASRPALNTQPLASDIAALKFSGQNQARVSLRPSHLGEVEIRLKVTQSGTQIELIAANDNAAELLNQSLPTLRAQLAGAGIQANAVEVSSDGGTSKSENDSLSQHEQHRSGPGAQNRGRGDQPTDASRTPNNIIELASINRHTRLLDARA